MSDAPADCNSSSTTNLIEVQHVGVTAKIQSPLQRMLPDMSSSTEPETSRNVYYLHNKTKYSEFFNDTTDGASCTEFESSKVLYEMHATRARSSINPANNITPAKIEFQLYNKKPKCVRTGPKNRKRNTLKRKPTSARQKYDIKGKPEKITSEATVLQRLRKLLDSMSKSKSDQTKTTEETLINIDDPPEAKIKRAGQSTDTHIGIYPFEHGSAEYLRTTDCHPNLVSMILAERATHYATQFWAQFFGTLHIGVTFVVTFLLQSYRFILFSLINTLLVGFLEMTSDYLIKPTLAVLFNGFLQPPLIFVHNVFTSIHDILVPVADTLNNFMKPVATVGRSIRLVTVNHKPPKSIKQV